MEATITNLVEPGDTIVVGNNGIWGSRVCDMAARYGGVPKAHVSTSVSICTSHAEFWLERQAGVPAANVVNLEKEAGKAFSFEELSQAVTQHKPAVLFLCQVLHVCSVQLAFIVDSVNLISFCSFGSQTHILQKSGSNYKGT